MIRTYLSYRKAGLSIRASVRGQIHSWKLDIWYAPSNFRYWWFWRVYLSVLKRTNPDKFRETMKRINKGLMELAEIMKK